jgi:hypothetical protein
MAEKAMPMMQPVNEDQKRAPAGANSKLEETRAVG